MTPFSSLSANECATLVRRGEASALEITEAALNRTAAGNAVINSFTRVTAERARAEASVVDAARARGDALPPLAGVPYAVKNLFDIQGEVTLAGAKLRMGDAPTGADAALVRRLKAAGAVLTGALNMDAYAYGFTTENTHFGATRNPRDTTRVAGGSSGGSAAAVAAGFVSFSWGSGSRTRLPAPSPLRTVHAPFGAHGSSLSKTSFNIRLHNFSDAFTIRDASLLA